MLEPQFSRISKGPMKMELSVTIMPVQSMLLMAA